MPRQPQISTTVGPYVRQMYDELMARYGSGSTVLSIALRMLYEQNQTTPSIRDIQIEYSDDTMWFDVGPDGYDTRASYDQFEIALAQEIKTYYPAARISITNTDNDRISIYGQADHEDSPTINDIVGQVYSGFGWLVKA